MLIKIKKDYNNGFTCIMIWFFPLYNYIVLHSVLYMQCRVTLLYWSVKFNLLAILAELTPTECIGSHINMNTCWDVYMLHAWAWISWDSYMCILFWYDFIIIPLCRLLHYSIQLEHAWSSWFNCSLNACIIIVVLKILLPSNRQANYVIACALN